MNLLFTICGRAGSKGIKNKNIKNFLDKPLALYSLGTRESLLRLMGQRLKPWMTASRSIADLETKGIF